MTIFGNWKPLKIDEKLFLFSRSLNFCFDFLVMLKKRFDKKEKVNFKIYDVTTWLANN